VNLKFTSRCHQLTDSTLFAICDSIKTFVSLKEINLGFDLYKKLILNIVNFLSSCPQITDSGLQAIIQTLGSLVLLEKFSLRLGSFSYNGRLPQITDMAFSKMSDDWMELKFLENFTLHFFWYAVFQNL